MADTKSIYKNGYDKGYDDAIKCKFDSDLSERYIKMGKKYNKIIDKLVELELAFNEFRDSELFSYLRKTLYNTKQEKTK